MLRLKKKYLKCLLKNHLKCSGLGLLRCLWDITWNSILSHGRSSSPKGMARWTWGGGTRMGRTQAGVLSTSLEADISVGGSGTFLKTSVLRMCRGLILHSLSHRHSLVPMVLGTEPKPLLTYVKCPTAETHTRFWYLCCTLVLTLHLLIRIPEAPGGSWGAPRLWISSHAPLKMWEVTSQQRRNWVRPLGRKKPHIHLQATT